MGSNSIERQESADNGPQSGGANFGDFLNADNVQQAVLNGIKYMAASAAQTWLSSSCRLTIGGADQPTEQNNVTQPGPDLSLNRQRSEKDTGAGIERNGTKDNPAAGGGGARETKPVRESTCCDQLTVVPSNSSPMRPLPSGAKAETPTDDEVAKAIESLGKIAGFSDRSFNVVSGLDSLANDAATAIAKGDFKQLESMLAQLQQDPDGKAKLDELAQELTQLLNTTVTADTDGEFGLDFLTHHTNATSGGYLGETPELAAHLTVTASGINASGKAGLFTEPATADEESMRLQAIAVQQIQEVRASLEGFESAQ